MTKERETPQLSPDTTKELRGFDADGVFAIVADKAGGLTPLILGDVPLERFTVTESGCYAEQQPVQEAEMNQGLRSMESAEPQQPAVIAERSAIMAAATVAVTCQTQAPPAFARIGNNAILEKSDQAAKRRLWMKVTTTGTTKWCWDGSTLWTPG